MDGKRKDWKAVLHKCDCCGYYTLEDPVYEICSICWWQEDYITRRDPDFKGGANEVSLNEARINYKKFKASDRKYKQRVREPLPEELPENNSFSSSTESNR